MKQQNKNQNNQFKGQEGFELFYSELFGNRWEHLKKAFFEKNQAVEFRVPESKESYFLDSASVLAALCLPLKEAESILDLCAAPGGKTLVLASRMNEDAHLDSNERSPDRKKRLYTVVNTCLPESINSRINVTCSDGATWCRKKTECYDSILLDAPCSSERHVIADPKYLNAWSLSRIKTVTTEQWALLSSAYRMLKVDGYLLYSTCALCNQENDEMMERLIKKFNKKEDSFIFADPSPDVSEIKDFVNINLPDTEKTKYGYSILPDIQSGAGPIYFSLIKKIKSVNSEE